ncbi:Quinate permease [Fusarium acutatum]|uniref:Quinate permease n=1 Tax=Fusarium acutatum TaxID=78861 RepID=A0A8H4JDW6_9HYPO|nr:Quinate permease [Fusarium acutatum]
MFNPNADEVGAVVSLFTGGGFFVALAAGPMGDWLGRRPAIMVGAIIFCVGGALQAAGQSLSFFYAGRAIGGLGVGILVMIVPMYQAEIAHPSIRGRVTGLQQLMLGIGAVFSTWTVYGTNLHYYTSKQWRIPLGIQIIPAGILALMILLFPESPRWLIDHGKEEEGLKTLAKLHANGNESDPWVQAEYLQIQSAIAQEHELEAKGYRELFTDRSSFRRLFLLFIVTNWCYQVSFSFTCGSLSWIIPAEVFDTKTRSKGISIGVMTSFAFNTMIGQVTAPAIENIGWRYFLLFVICNFTNAVFFWAFMPETKLLPLEEMNVLFSSTSWFVPGTSQKRTGDLDARVEEAKWQKEDLAVGEAETVY